MWKPVRYEETRSENFFQSCHFKISRGRPHVRLRSAVKSLLLVCRLRFWLSREQTQGPVWASSNWPRKWSPPSQDTGNSRLSHFQRFTARPTTYPSCRIYHFYQPRFRSCFTLRSHHIYMTTFKRLLWAFPLRWDFPLISANAARLVVAVELIHAVKEVCLHKKLARFCWGFFGGGGG